MGSEEVVGHLFDGAVAVESCEGLQGGFAGGGVVARNMDQSFSGNFVYAILVK